MILPFKDRFVTKILTGTKIHTIRIDKHKRWKPGRLIHFATGTRTKDYVCFQQDTCKSVQDVELKFYRNGLVLISIDGKNPLLKESAMQFAANDGFDNFNDFYDFFVSGYAKKNFKVLTLKARLIHWTDFKY